MSNEKITSLDVYKFYDQKIKDSVSKNTNEYIDKIFDNSNYDKKLADELVPKIDIQNEQIEAYNKKFYNKPKFFSRLKGLIIFFGILLALGVTLGVLGFLSISILWLGYLGIGLGSLGFILFIVFMVLYFKWKKQAQIEKTDITPILEQNKADIAAMHKEMRKVINSIKARDCFDIYEKSFENFKINNHISEEDYSIWEDVLSQNKNESLYCELHGGVYYHPFMYLICKCMEMRDVPYTGSTIVTYTTSDGHGGYRTHTTTVTATIYKPKPFYEKDTHFVYKINAYPDLTFNSLPSLKNEHAVNKFYKQHKEYEKMENPKFDLLLPFERSDDLQFHTVFSIFTQEQIVNCIEQYGLENLKIVKTGRFVYTNLDNNLTNKNLVYSGDVFLDYNPKVIRDNFIKAMNDNMKFLYQYMSPIFSVGLFQQERFIIPKSKASNNNAVGCMIQKFINSNATTTNYFHPKTSNVVYDAIPSTKVLYANPNYAVTLMRMESFSHANKVENVTKYFQGKVVIVPVHYLEFHPLENEYLTLSWLNNKSMSDCIIENKDEYMASSRIKAIYKYLDQVVVIFEQDVKSISGKENLIISKVNSYFK